MHRRSLTSTLAIFMAAGLVGLIAAPASGQSPAGYRRVAGPRPARQARSASIAEQAYYQPAEEHAEPTHPQPAQPERPEPQRSYSDRYAPAPTSELPHLEEGVYYDPGYAGGYAEGYPSCGATCGSACGDGCCLPCCCLPIYASVEGLLWWSNGDHVPPLVTTSPVGTPFAQSGALNQPTTSILYGDDGLGDSLRGGVRVVVGTCWGQCGNVEFTYLSLFEESDNFFRDSDETRNIGRPFLNINEAVDDHQAIAFLGDEGELTGSIRIRYDSDFYGMGVLWKHTLFQIDSGCCQSKLRLLAGYRFLSLRESLGIRTHTTVVDDPGALLVPGTELDVAEAFDADNTFHGGDVGLAATFGGPCASLELYGKIAIGSSHEEISIRGASSTSVPDEGTETVFGGLLTQPSNIGTYKRSQAAFVPELGTKLHYQINPCWQFTAGYTFLFWSNVARPGEQVDLAVNTTQLGGGELDGAPRPEFAFLRGNYWAHGLSLGLEYKY
jgi:hypothetical protein